MRKRSKPLSFVHSLLKRKWLLAGLVVLIVGGGYLAWNHNTPTKSSTASAAGSAITPAPDANNAKRTPASQNTSVNQGGANDQNGRVPSTSSADSSQWSIATSGLITLKNPVKNGSFKSGDSIDGAAAAGPVQFRLIDNQVGVVAQGTINVVSGQFSAVANFTPYSSSGRLDVFNTDPNGRETNEVQVPVNF